MKYNKELQPIESAQEASRTHELIRRCRVEAYDPKKSSWEEIGKDILRIELSAFGEEKAFDEEMLKDDFQDPESVIVLVKDGAMGKIVAFTYAKPTAKTYPEDYPDRPVSQDTAYIYDTAIEKSYQEQRLVSMLMAKLEQELLARGFSFLERDADNNRDVKKPEKETYADKVRKNYQDRILKEEPHDSEYGQQVYFRIRLGKSSKPG